MKSIKQNLAQLQSGLITRTEYIKFLKEKHPNLTMGDWFILELDPGTHTTDQRTHTKTADTTDQAQLSASINRAENLQDLVYKQADDLAEADARVETLEDEVTQLRDEVKGLKAQLRAKAIEALWDTPSTLTLTRRNNHE